jgi:hypothetical protein
MYLTELPIINKNILLHDEYYIAEWVDGKRYVKFKVIYDDGCYASYEVEDLVISPVEVKKEHVVKRTLYNPDGAVDFVDKWDAELGYRRIE